MVLDYQLEGLPQRVAEECWCFWGNGDRPDSLVVVETMTDSPMYVGAMHTNSLKSKTIYLCTVAS